MIKVNCIQKFYKNNKIYGYRIQDCNGVTKDVTAEQLKQAINNKSVYVNNLTLTSDNRLISTSERITHTAKDNKKIIYGKEAVDKLIHSDGGTPVMIKLTDAEEYKQTVFLGIRDIQCRELFVFFDGTALDGEFALSSKFIENNAHKIKFKFDENEPEELAHLLSLLHK